MTITDQGGRARIRQFTILRRDQTDGGDQDYVVLFSRPADVRNTVFLVKKHVGKGRRPLALSPRSRFGQTYRRR